MAYGRFAEPAALRDPQTERNQELPSSRHGEIDEFHGLRISVRGFEGKWPVSTIRLTQTDFGAQGSRLDNQQDPCAAADTRA